ncbi:hypothetical protein DL767_009377 [Monosporascus sp. MG133]|nr:hypothetical protein DL767_009377 [Monosporascus sp. MG133]
MPHDLRERGRSGARGRNPSRSGPRDPSPWDVHERSAMFWVVAIHGVVESSRVIGFNGTEKDERQRIEGRGSLTIPYGTEATAAALDAGLDHVVDEARSAPASTRVLRSAPGPAEDENAARLLIGKRGALWRGEEASRSGGVKRGRTAAEVKDGVTYIGGTTDSDGDSVFDTRSPMGKSTRPRDLRGDMSDDTVQEPRARRSTLNDRVFREHPEGRYPTAMTAAEAESELGLISDAGEMIDDEDREAMGTSAGDDRPGMDDTHLRVDGESQEWLQLWRTTLHLFRAAPHDLFTWGLRLAPTATEGESRRLWRDLEALMTHPLWDRRLYALRYFLQKAVCLRAPGHMEPLCPLSRDYIEVLAAHRSSLSRMGPEAYAEGDLLSSEMQLTARDPPPAPEASVSDDTLFFMERRDVVLVRASLDSLRTKWHFGRSVNTYALAYSRAASAMLLLPSSRRQMNDWDRRCAANKSRNRAANGPDVPERERLPAGQEWYWKHRDCDYRFVLTLYAVSGSDDQGRGVDDDAAALEYPAFDPHLGSNSTRQTRGGVNDRRADGEATQPTTGDVSDRRANNEATQATTGDDSDRRANNEAIQATTGDDTDRRANNEATQATTGDDSDRRADDRRILDGEREGDGPVDANRTGGNTCVGETPGLPAQAVNNAIRTALMDVGRFLGCEVMAPQDISSLLGAGWDERQVSQNLVETWHGRRA